MKIKMIRTVRPDLPLSKPGTALIAGKTYEAKANRFGAVCGVCANGETIGLKPAEFEFVSLPKWLYDLWEPRFPYSVYDAEIEGEAV